jgi:hypothetical protein
MARVSSRLRRTYSISQLLGARYLSVGTPVTDGLEIRVWNKLNLAGDSIDKSADGTRQNSRVGRVLNSHSALGSGASSVEYTIALHVLVPGAARGKHRFAQRCGGGGVAVAASWQVGHASR